MLHHWSDANLIFLNKDNIDCYLPGITHLTKTLSVDVKGRLDRFKRKFIPNKSDLAVKCDVYRANILNQYGGIYCDASAIALGSLSSYFDSIEKDQVFLVSQRQSHHKDHYPVSFYGCPAHSSIISEYVQQIDRLLEQKNEFHYNEIGALCLTPIVNRLKPEARILNENEIMPVTFEDADSVYLQQGIEIEEVINGTQSVFKLFNNPFKTTLADASIEELYYADVFIGELFRKAIPEPVYKKLYNQEFR
jgi:hypothetical protein